MKFIIYPNNKPENAKEYEAPIKVVTNSYLDEMLNTSPIELRDTKEDKPFEPFTICALFETANAAPIYWMVASDTVEEVRGTMLYNHTLQLIEPTKWLERWMVGSKTVTQPLYREYTQIDVDKSTSDAYPPNTVIGQSREDIDLLSNKKYKTPLYIGDSIPIYDLSAFASLPSGASVRCTVYKDGAIVYQDYTTDTQTTISATFGYYTVSYYITWTKTTGNYSQSFYSYGEYNFYVVSSANVQRKTLFDAAEAFIYASQNLIEGESSIFSLKAEDEERLSAIESPELSLTSATLREALDEVGKCIGAITELQISIDGGAFAYSIHFNNFCKDTQADLSELGTGTSVVLHQSCEDYCTALDATVANLVQYGDGGSIASPTGRSDVPLWKTVRTESATYRVTEDDAEISTDFPIERLDAVYVRVLDGSTYKEAEITPFVYESAEYGTLSSYNDVYPLSKGYALEYTIGQKGIRGLGFTLPNAVAEILKEPAIYNILKKAVSYSRSSIGFLNLQFRVVYVPTGVARVRTRKPDSLGKAESVLAFNQSASKLDARAFGRNMFGAVLRMGNPQKQISYTTRIGAKVPQIGERIGADGFIAEIKQEYANGTKKVTLTVVEAFNRLSAFVGVNQSLRLFEISERMSVDRHLIAEDFLRISTKQDASSRVSPICTAVLGDRVRTIFGTNVENANTNAVANSFFDLTAIAQGYDAQGNALAKCLLPCCTYGIGNAFVASFSYLDNYAAGRRNSGGADTTTNGEYFATQSDVTYGDYFGEIEHLKLDLVTFNGTSGTITNENKLAFANALPAYEEDKLSGITLFTVATTGNDRRLLVKKDGRECFKSVSYQLNIMEDDGVIISPKIAEFLQYHSGNKQLRLVILDTEINEMTDTVPHSNDTAVNKTVSISGTFPNYSGTIQTSNIPDVVDLSNMKAWAIAYIDLSSGTAPERATFLFGKNEPITRAKNITLYFNFFRK